MSDSFIVALNDSDDKRQYQYDHTVKYVIRQERIADYLSAAAFINRNGVGICCIQHEFGVFGGRSSKYLLTLTKALKVPYTIIFHTVLKSPDTMQMTIMKTLAYGASSIVVMSEKAVQLLRDIYHILPSKIKCIPHGVPDFEILDLQAKKHALDFPFRKTLLTFGLISPNKGLETVIRALPTIREQHPDIQYIILGKTHPGIKKVFGEGYRESLQYLAKTLGVERHLLFISAFVSEEDLHAYLTACDIYITPYLNEEQITSGTLSYAIGAGAVVVSTPYWHACELLKENRGRLFGFDDYLQLSVIVNNLLNRPAEIEVLKQNAYVYGLSLRWPKIGKQYAQLFKAVLTETKTRVIASKSIVTEAPTSTNPSSFSLRPS
ncbi:glycosyltransferase [Parapedobacter tibetensis]|uniref:glycosyltransferase n=1 Tax=Parapedobacter tibetensis TaxID=2972951 RepID=UPI00214D8896|nr:glycosyltransferase [Parapedobacter tibetensis]